VGLSTYLKVVQRRLWIILLTALVAAAVVAAASARVSATYTASTRLRIVPNGLAAVDYGAYVYFERLANTYSDILTSDLITEEAEEMLGLEELPDFSIEIIPQTELMRLTVTANDAALAQTVANTLTELLVEQNRNAFSADISGIQAVLREQLSELETNLNDLIAEKTALENQVPRLTERIADLERTINTLEQNYDLLQTQYQQTAISQLARANALTVIEPATLPDEPNDANLIRNVVLAGAVGLMGGVALAFILENRNPRLYTSEQLEAVAHAPIIGKIPSIRRGYHNNVFNGDPSASEAFRRLRASLFAGAKNVPMRLILVTSAIPKEGKTTVAANLATAVAQNGRKVLLVDGNMQQPELDRRFRLSSDTGLSDVLREDRKLEEVVQNSDIPNLQLMPAGFALADSAELLHSEELTAFIDRLLHYYDVVIFDGPALLASTDSAVLAPYMSGVLWVIDTEKVDRRVAQFAHEQLESVNANVVGVVANRTTKDESFHWVRHYRSKARPVKAEKHERIAS
jgi:capsular exopolysaccharide synthesis family protein